MTLFEYGDDIVIDDAGLAFPEDEMLGIDLVIPDFTYLKEHREKVRGLVITHGHEDHVGAVPYLLREIPVPVFASRLALGLIEEKLAEHHLQLPEGSRVYAPGDRISLGQNFVVEPFRVNHSIPDAYGLAIRTPVGIVVHTGDFKIDMTPVDGRVADLQRLAELGREQVLVLMSDSTNAERAGYTPSEKTVGQVLDRVMGTAPGRVLVATFASNVHRIQQVIDAAVHHHRHVAVVGRSMENTVQVALELGYLNVKPGALISIEEIKRYKGHQLAILTTGSQGEPLSALTRMATGSHRWVEIVPGDTVVISASPIPGNETMIYRTVDNLYHLGADVIYGLENGVHVSGHASQEELKLMLNLVRPRYFIPVHGEWRHLIRHGRLAESVGIPPENVLIGENGSVFEIRPEGARINGKVAAGDVLIDGLGVGDVGAIVLRDRKQLSQDGVLIVVVTMDRQNHQVVGGPDVVSRGFVYVRESEPLMEELKQKVSQALATCQAQGVTDWNGIKAAVRDEAGRFLFDRTRRRPMILPIIVEV
ncbi:MAG: ribonuclease J [Clostridia bacterium]|nr:ribonuclease J [Clostridia bacterium]MCL6521010.1 ribonuclease J [Bacillota bacterium]